MYRTAAAFAISRMLTTPSRYKSLISPLIYSYLHDPWTKTSEGPQLDEDDSEDIPDADTRFTQSPQESLTTLTLLFANINPSPTLVSTILSPIIPPLYCLWAHTKQIKTADPELREYLTAILSTWGRIGSMEEITRVMWSIIQGEGGYWTIDIAGDIRRTNEYVGAWLHMFSCPSAVTDDGNRPPGGDQLAMLTPEDVKRAAESEDSELDSNFLNLRPDPAIFVKFLLSLQQSDLAVSILIRLLQAYREARSSPSSNPLTFVRTAFTDSP